MGLSDEILADLKAKKGGGGKPPAPPAGMAKDNPPNDPQTDGEYADDEESIAADILAAKDPASMAEALKAFLDVCVPKIVGGMG